MRQVSALVPHATLAIFTRRLGAKHFTFLTRTILPTAPVIIGQFGHEFLKSTTSLETTIQNEFINFN